MMLDGTDSVPVSQFVLRRIKTVAGNTTITADYTNILRYWSTSELIIAESVPTFLHGGLPGGIWIKKTPTTDQISGTNKWTITQEWDNGDSAASLLWKHKA